jgi:acetyltransferase
MKARLAGRDRDLGFTVQKMISGGREVILGMARDPNFGPLILFGLGGIFVEVLRDVAVRIHPLTDVDAREMVRKIKGYPLLAGARGEKAVDIGCIEEGLLRLSQLVSDLEADLSELDINPFIVTDRSAGSFVVDARISLT